MKKTIILALIATMAISVIGAGCSSSKSSTTSEVKSSATTADKSKAEDTNASSEKVVYEKDGLKITYLGIEEGIISQDVQFTIENNSETDYIIQTDDVSVNDCNLTTLFSVEVNKGKKATDEMSFLSSDLEKNKIEKIEKVEFNFKFLDPDTFQTKFTSDPIVINP